MTALNLIALGQVTPPGGSNSYQISSNSIGSWTSSGYLPDGTAYSESGDFTSTGFNNGASNDSAESRTCSCLSSVDTVYTVTWIGQGDSPGYIYLKVNSYAGPDDAGDGDMGSYSVDDGLGNTQYQEMSVNDTRDVKVALTNGVGHFEVTESAQFTSQSMRYSFANSLLGSSAQIETLGVDLTNPEMPTYHAGGEKGNMAITNDDGAYSPFRADIGLTLDSSLEHLIYSTTATATAYGAWSDLDPLVAINFGGTTNSHPSSVSQGFEELVFIDPAQPGQGYLSQLASDEKGELNKTTSVNSGAEDVNGETATADLVIHWHYPQEDMAHEIEATDVEYVSPAYQVNNGNTAMLHPFPAESVLFSPQLSFSVNIGQVLFGILTEDWELAAFSVDLSVGQPPLDSFDIPPKSTGYLVVIANGQLDVQDWLAYGPHGYSGNPDTAIENYTPVSPANGEVLCWTIPLSQPYVLTADPNFKATGYKPMGYLLQTWDGA